MTPLELKCSTPCEKNGFVSVGVFKKGVTESKVAKKLTKLLDDQAYRLKLFESLKKFRFDANKDKVITKMLEVMSSQVRGHVS